MRFLYFLAVVLVPLLGISQTDYPFKNPKNPKLYNSASVGFNNLILHKTYLLTLI